MAPAVEGYSPGKRYLAQMDGRDTDRGSPCRGDEAGLAEGDAVAVTDDAVLSLLATSWSHKWDGRWHYQVRDGHLFNPGGGGDALVFAVAPAKVVAFGKGSFTHTTYRF
jgi:hypothetical protein